MLKRLGLRLALLVGALVTLYGVLEIGTRIFSDIGPGLTIADPIVGRKYRPGYSGDVFVPEAGRRVRLRFNREGFRGPDRPVEKPPGVHRVAILGDSFVFGAANDEEKTLAVQLESMLNGSGDDAVWEAFNFGVSGSSPGQALVVYREIARRYEPDVVVCVFAVINDLIDVSHRLSDGAAIYFDLDERGELRQLPPRLESEKHSEWFSRHSRFYTWQKLTLREIRYRFRKQAGVLKPGKRIFSTVADDDLQHAWSLLEEILRTFASAVRADGGRFVLAVVPAPEEIYDDYWRDTFDDDAVSTGELARDYPNRRLARIAEAAQAPIVLMTERFRAAAPSARLDVESEWLFLGGIGHLNDEGNRLAAQALFESLDRRF